MSHNLSNPLQQVEVQSLQPHLRHLTTVTTILCHGLILVLLHLNVHKHLVLCRRSFLLPCHRCVSHLRLSHFNLEIQDRRSLQVCHLTVPFLILGNPSFPLREDNNRSFSLPLPGPIGEPRKVPAARAFSGDYKTSREKELWKPEPEWTSWPGVPVVNPPRQLTGAASLGIVYNDQQTWPDVFYSLG